MNHFFNKYGFTLTELLIVLAIVSILATLTVPSYSHYLYKTRRADAVASLLQIHLAQEQWRAQHGQYSQTLVELGWQNGDSADRHYQLDLEWLQNGQWRATAKPVGIQSGDSCPPFAIDVNGPLYGGTFAEPSCWNR